MKLTSEEALKILEDSKGKKKCDRLDLSFDMRSEIQPEKLQKP